TTPRAVLAHPLLGHACRGLAMTAEAHYAAAERALANGRSQAARIAALMLGSCRGLHEAVVVRGWRRLEQPVRLSAWRKVRLLLRYSMAAMSALARPWIDGLARPAGRARPIAH